MYSEGAPDQIMQIQVHSLGNPFLRGNGHEPIGVVCWASEWEVRWVICLLIIKPIVHFWLHYTAHYTETIACRFSVSREGGTGGGVIHRVLCTWQLLGLAVK